MVSYGRIGFLVAVVLLVLYYLFLSSSINSTIFKPCECDKVAFNGGFADKQVKCDSTKPERTVFRYYKDRDPFKDPYQSVPLDRVLAAQREASSKDWERRVFISKFASSIIERDKDKPEVLRFDVINSTLFAQLPTLRPYWVYWNDGIDNAKHEIVQVMWKNTRKAAVRQNNDMTWSNISLTLLSDSNLDQYVQFPDYIIEKRKAKKMSTTYFSDILRAELMASYGGFWADSTFFFDKHIPQEVYDADLFVFKIFRNPGLLSSWFIGSARPLNPYWLWMRHLLREYWKTHDSHDYFDFHRFFESLHYLMPELAAYYDAAPFYSSAKAHSLHHFLGKPTYNKTNWLLAKENSWGFKLSYKSNCPFLDELKQQANS